MPTSKETRVLVEDFSKIMPRVFPFRVGRALPRRSIFFKTAARFRMLSMSFGARSETASRSFFMRAPKAGRSDGKKVGRYEILFFLPSYLLAIVPSVTI